MFLWVTPPIPLPDDIERKKNHENPGEMYFFNEKFISEYFLFLMKLW